MAKISKATRRFTQDSARDVLRKFRTLFATVKAHFSEVEKRCGLGGSQLWALAEVASDPGKSVQALSDALLVHQSTASNLVERLVESGLITRKRSTQDRRQVRLHPTAKGLRLLAKAPAPVMGVLPDALERLPRPVLKALDQNMSALIHTMKRKKRGSESRPLSDL